MIKLPEQFVALAQRLPRHRNFSATRSSAPLQAKRRIKKADQLMCSVPGQWSGSSNAPGLVLVPRVFELIRRCRRKAPNEIGRLILHWWILKWRTAPLESHLNSWGTVRGLARLWLSTDYIFSPFVLARATSLSRSQRRACLTLRSDLFPMQEFSFIPLVNTISNKNSV